MRKTHTLFFLGHRTLLFLAFALMCLNVSAQDATDADYIVVHIDDLDAYSYGDLARSLKTNDQVSIAEACVPASLVAFKITAGNQRSTEENVIYIKSLIGSSTQLQTVHFKEGFTEADLRNQCYKARRGLLSE